MKVVFVITLVVAISRCLQIIPERASVVYANEKYVANASAFVTRYGRNSPYYMNIIGVNKHTWGNNVTINLVLHEYLHNEYRRSFVEFHFKLCDMINSDPYVGAMVANVGITCPVPPKLQRLVNMTVPSTVNFKFKWPFKKCMAQVEFALTSTGESMAMGNFYLTFADKKFQL
ncbi:uncharacterized protein LOC135081688 isoform X2 [Ostrinia nubilalis]|uniref:uncharacterized protein LOC135081688 isoform X2 n=1 Tax=Ostrinia nubilalis TaxID=29057 RepID=UPI0030822961